MTSARWKKVAVALPWVLVGALFIATSDPYVLSVAIGTALAIGLAVAAKRRWAPGLRVPGVLRTRAAQSAAMLVFVALHLAGLYLEITLLSVAGVLLMLLALVPLVMEQTRPYRDDRRRRLHPDHGQRIRRQ